LPPDYGLQTFGYDNLTYSRENQSKTTVQPSISQASRVFVMSKIFPICSYVSFIENQWGPNCIIWTGPFCQILIVSENNSIPRSPHIFHLNFIG